MYPMLEDYDYFQEAEVTTITVWLKTSEFTRWSRIRFTLPHKDDRHSTCDVINDYLHITHGC